MRVLFVYTDANAPSVGTLKNVVKLEESTSGADTIITATTANSQTVAFNLSQGQLALLWE